MSKVTIKNKSVRPATDKEIEKICTVYTNFLADDRGVHPVTQEPLFPEYTNEERIDQYIELKKNTNFFLTQIELEDGSKVSFFTSIDSYSSQLRSMSTKKIRTHIDVCCYNFQLCDNGDIIRLEENEALIPQESAESYEKSVNSDEWFESI